MHCGAMLDFHFVPFNAYVVHWVVHVYTAVFSAQPHSWFAFKVYRIHGVHSVGNAVMVYFFVLIFFTGWTRHKHHIINDRVHEYRDVWNANPKLIWGKGLGGKTKGYFEDFNLIVIVTVCVICLNIYYLFQ